MLDDLVRWGINEPYRMLTSRNEYRLLHRQDNALERLSPVGHAWGLISDERLAEVRTSEARVAREVQRLSKTRHEGTLASKIICRPGMTYQEVIELVGKSPEGLSAKEQKKAEILVKYAAYIARSQKELEARKDYESLSLQSVDFERVSSLSKEGGEMLKRHRPTTLGAAQRIRGVRDSDVTALLIHAKTHGKPLSGANVSRETASD